jgi:hypothetical protein
MLIASIEEKKAYPISVTEEEQVEVIYTSNDFKE